MTPQEKLDAIEKILLASHNGSNEFPFSIIRAQFTRSIIFRIQDVIYDPKFAYPPELD